MASAFWQSIIGIGAIGIPRPSLPVTAMVPQSLRAAARAQTGAVGPSMRLSAPAFAPIRAGVRLQQQRGAAPLQQHQRRQRQQRAATRARAVRVNALRNIDWPQALLFDCDGVSCSALGGARGSWCASRALRAATAHGSKPLHATTGGATRRLLLWLHLAQPLAQS